MCKLPKLNNLPPKNEVMYKKYNKEQMMDLIAECHGLISFILLKTGFNYRQIYNALDKYDLRDYLKQTKQQLIDSAELTLYQGLKSENEALRIKAASEILKFQQPQIAQQINIMTEKDKEIEVKNIFGIKDDK